MHLRLVPDPPKKDTPEDALDILRELDFSAKICSAGGSGGNLDPSYVRSEIVKLAKAVQAERRRHVEEIQRLKDSHGKTL